MISIQGAKQGQQQGAVVKPHEVLKRIIAVSFTAHMGETAGLAVEIPKNAVQRQLARGEVRSYRVCRFYGFVRLGGGNSAGRAKISVALKLGSKSFTWALREWARKGTNRAGISIREFSQSAITVGVIGTPNSWQRFA